MNSPLEVAARAHHFGISVPNLEDAVQWYQEKLEFRVLKQFEIAELKMRGAFMGIQGFQLEIIERTGSQPSSMAQATAVEQLLLQGIKYIAFAVDDVDKVASTLKQRGVEIAWEPVTFEQLKFRFCHVKDNNGNLIKIVQELD